MTRSGRFFRFHFLGFRTFRFIVSSCRFFYVSVFSINSVFYSFQLPFFSLPAAVLFTFPRRLRCGTFLIVSSNRCCFHFRRFLLPLFPSPFGKPPLGTSPVDKPPLSTTPSADATTPAGVVEIATREGQVLRKELTDKTAATLLDMMAAVKRG